MLGNNMFAYCRNNPVKRKDASGTDDICVTTNEDDDSPLNDIGTNFRPGGAGGGGGIASGSSNANRGEASKNSQGSYSPPPGGGGVSSSVKVGNTTVEFGHGGRHVGGEDITEIEAFIAKDVINRPPTVGNANSVYIDYFGKELYYSYFTRSAVLINVGTYYFYRVPGL